MEMRRTNKTHIVTAMVLSVACLLTGCGSDKAGEVQTESDKAVEEVTTDIVIVIENDVEGDQDKNPDKDTTNEKNVADIYGYVLEEYSHMVQNDFFVDLRDSDTYESSFGEDIGLEIRTHKQDIYYTFYDIDGNGTEELMIAGGENAVSSPSFSPWNYDLYGYDGSKVVHIFPEMEFGYRINFSLYENGVIEVFYSSSAAESGVDFYRIGNDGFTPELVDSFTSVAHLEGDQPVFVYSQNGNEITEEEYSAKIQSYEIELEWRLEWVQVQ